VSAVEKLAGAGAVIMAICCAVLPLLGAAIGGVIAGAGTIGLVVGLVVLAVVVGVVSRRRKAGSRC
jgi:hypothetical protein